MSLKYHVVYCTSEGEGASVQELYDPSKTSKGWQSMRFPDYPQSLIVQFEGEVNVKKMKILSHQWKIAKRIELFIGEVKDITSLQQEINSTNLHKYCTFKRLGHVRLESNEETKFKKCELKKVTIDAICSLMKLVFHECHHNELNYYHQIGLIALQFIGTVKSKFSSKVLEPFRDREAPQIELETLKPKLEPSHSHNSIVDKVTIQKIQELKLKKEKAVKSENFLEAQKIKDQIDHIKRISAQLEELEKQKQIAVEKEDFVRAQQLKIQIESLRNSEPPPRNKVDKQDADVRKSITTHISDYQFQGDDHIHHNVQEIIPKAVPDALSDPTPHEIHADQEKEDQVQKPNPPRVTYTGDDIPHDEKPIKPLKINFFDAQDDSTPGQVVEPKEVLPTNSRQPKKPQRKQQIPSKKKGVEDSAILVPPGEEKQKEKYKPSSSWETNLVNYIRGNNNCDPPDFPKEGDHGAMVKAVGAFTVRCILDKKDRTNREVAIRGIMKYIEDIPSPSLFQSLCQILKLTLNDKIPQVYFASVELLHEMMAKLLKPEKKNSPQASLDPLIPILLNRSTETNTRVKDSSLQLLLKMAEKVSCSMIVQHLLIVPKKQLGWKPLFAQLHILGQLIPIYGFSNSSGLKMASVIKFLVQSFMSSSGEVKGEATKVTVETFQHSNMTPNEFLEKHFKSKIKDAIYKNLESELKEKKCPLCGEMLAESIEKHLITTCFCICQCFLCKVFVEAWELHDHFFENCSENNNFLLRCEKCRATIPSAEFDAHINAGTCELPPPKEEAEFCPLCSEMLVIDKPRMEVWVEHLRQCAENSRAPNKKNQ